MVGGSLWRGARHFGRGCPSARFRSSYRRRPTSRLEGEAVRYMLLVCVDPSIEVTPDEASADAWAEEMDGRGVRRQGQRLRPISDATTVRLREGEAVLWTGRSPRRRSRSPAST